MSPLRSRASALLAVASALVVGACSDSDGPVVLRHSLAGVGPTIISLTPGTTQQLTVSDASGKPTQSARFASLDSCVARVSASGLVSGIRPGVTAVHVTDSSATYSFTASVPVTVTELASLPLTIQSVTTGSPPVPADPDRLRGTIAIQFNLSSDAYRSLELTLGGRKVGEQAVPATGEDHNASLSFTVDTAERDATGAPLYPDGPQLLQARAIHRDYAPGCPGGPGMLTAHVTLANG